MTDIATEHDSAIRLVIGEYRKLQEHDTKHELLKYLSEVWDFGIAYSSDESIISEFTLRYGLDDALAPHALAKYYVDLRTAVDVIEGIDRSPKPNKPIDNNPTRMWDIKEDGMPPF